MSDPVPSAAPSIERATVVIIGSGFAGMGAAVRLMEAGVRDVVLLERAEAVGGTWRDNVYPGCACDVPSHLYSYSFHLNPDWSHHYAKQPEIRAYLEGVRRHYRLDRLLRLGADVVRSVFDDARGLWTVECRDGRRFEARFVIGGLGPLRIPRLPEVAGRERFAGPAFHSAEWDASVDLTGQRVGIVGSGASAVQIVPNIAEEAGDVQVFQRTPPWVAPRFDPALPGWLRRAFRAVPPLMLAARLLIYLRQELYFFLLFGGPEVTRRWVERAFTRHIVAEMGSEDAAAPLIPDYTPGCKRILSSTEWYPALRRDDVTLHPSAVAEVTETGVILANGRTVELDVLVWCTGFRVDEPLGTVDVLGRGGQSLRETWGHRPRAHLGVTMPGFPNLFLLLGPNTGLGHNSVVIMIEAQLRYVVRAIRYTLARGERAWVEPTAAAEAAFVAEMNDRQGDKVWATGCDSWYQNAAGENFSIWPGSTLGYMLRTARFDAENYTVGSPAAPEA